MAARKAAPAKDVSRLEAEAASLASAVAVLEQRWLVTDEAAKAAKAADLKQQADAIHAEHDHMSAMYLALMVESARKYVRHNQIPLPPWHILFASGEHTISPLEMRDTDTAKALAALRAEAEAIGRGTWVDVSPHRDVLPTHEHRVAAAGLIASL